MVNEQGLIIPQLDLVADRQREKELNNIPIILEFISNTYVVYNINTVKQCLYCDQ